MSSGPFTMGHSDTQVVVLGFTITRDGGNNFQNVCALQNLSDSVLYYYYHDFPMCIPIGLQPISTEVPDKFMLYQNFPNPFNPATKIKFDIPAGTRRGLFVQIKIYDILGREIATLVDEQLKPGTYEVQWDGANNASGIYYYKLVSDKFSETKKMVMLK
jgi:hypothetical protein